MKQPIEGPDSLFTRLLASKQPIYKLKETFRMNPYLMKIPNNWFYEGEMENRYNKEIRNKFINLDKPFLFINLPTDDT